MRALLDRGGIANGLDPRRGFDHGTFSLMHTLYPGAEVPLVQLSLRADYDPAAHLRVGALLAPLREQGVLIVGSGFSFHNLQSMRNGAGARASAAFDARLGDTLTALPPEERRERLLHWSTAPAARLAHPQEDT